MWARRGEPGYHSPRRACGVYPYRGSITKLRHPPPRIPASDIHGLCHSSSGVTGIPPVNPCAIVFYIVYIVGLPTLQAELGNCGERIYTGVSGEHSWLH